MTTLRLPWPPSVNHYWRYGHGHFHISPEGQRYKLAVRGIIAAAGVRPLEGNVQIVIDAYPPDRRRRDLDNIEKALLDACVVRHGFATGLYRDDCQIKRKVSTMHDFAPERAGYVTLSVAPWPEPEAVGVRVDAPKPRLRGHARAEEPEPAFLSVAHRLGAWWSRRRTGRAAPYAHARPFA